MGQLEACGWGTPELVAIGDAYTLIQELEEPKPTDVRKEEEESTDTHRHNGPVESSSNPLLDWRRLFQTWTSLGV